MRIAMGIAVFAAALSVAIPVQAVDQEKLDAVIAARPAEDRARDQFRHPAETLAFFGIEPGMTVVDALPGSWYGRIFVPYLGPEGRYYGVEYSLDLYRMIYRDGYERRQKRIESWPDRFLAEMAMHSEEPPALGTFRIGAPPEELVGQVDAYLFFRALHHLNRFEPDILDETAAEVFTLVKPGGIVGIVQHSAPETASNEWANGNNGYLKASRVISAFMKAGFILEATSEINANPKDQPTEEEFVWRLPPSWEFGDQDREKYAAIGETNRMTLRFRKPE